MSFYKKIGTYKDIAKKIILAAVFIGLIGILFVTANNQSGIVSNSNNDISIHPVDEQFFTMKITVTENFGNSLVFSKEAEVLKGESAMDALNKVADITCIYGGGFVESINGVKSKNMGGEGEKKGWFYYINGMLSPISAVQYILYPGDVERWDFHDWSSNRMVTAIIGDFPEPFLHGFRGNVRDTVIVYSKKFSDSAYELQQALDDVGVSISVKLFEELSNNEKCGNNLILIGEYDNLLINELNKDFYNLGWFIEFYGNDIKIFTESSKEKQIFDHGGIIIATQNPWNSKGNWNGENVVWVVSGITAEDVDEAVETLVNNPEGIKNSISVVIVDGNIFEVP